MLELIGFLLILSLLVFVHELGHFVVAKRSGITVEEFAIGFPPRAVKLWQDEGAISLDGQEYVIGRKLNVPRTIQPGVNVYAETETDEQGRPAITKLELVQPPEDEKETQQNNVSRLSKFFKRSAAPPRADMPVSTVDALTRPTEYTINWIPFGGYVRMVGEEDPTAPGSFASKSKRVRFAVLVAGSLMNLVTAVIFFSLTALSGIPETSVGTFVADVVTGAPADEAGLQVGDVIVGADDNSFQYRGDLVNYIDRTKGTEITLRLERDGEIVTTSLIPRVNPPAGQGAMGIGIEYIEVADIIVSEVMPGTPAAQAGVRTGDLIVGADGVDFKYRTDPDRHLETLQPLELTLRLERDGEMVTASLPAGSAEALDDLGLVLEFDPDTTITYFPVHEALVNGVTRTAQYIGLVFYMPIAILRNVLPAEAARPTGPVGIYRETANAVDAAVTLNWWFPIFSFTAIVSTALAVTNLLPLPALDGGRILFIVIEAIRGKRVSPEKEGAIHFIGLALLLTLMLVVTYYDISNPIPTIDWANFF